MNNIVDGIYYSDGMNKVIFRFTTMIVDPCTMELIPLSLWACEQGDKLRGSNPDEINEWVEMNFTWICDL